MDILMPHYKQLFSLDVDSLDILKELEPKKKSDYVRKALKHYNNYLNKDKIIPPITVRDVV